MTESSSTLSSLNIGKRLSDMREKRPLVHNITNLVVTNIAANALLSIGASPIMAHAREEVADMVRIVSALSLNMGTLDADTVEAMRMAGEAANAAGVPVVFDPVGIGATPYRNQTAEGLCSGLQLAILRGNAGEIGLMVGAGGTVKGVDSAGSGEDLTDRMRAYAKAHRCAVVATGETDYVTDGETVWALQNGDSYLAAITGSGCMLTAILGAFAGTVERPATAAEYARAAIAAVTCYNVAAELAAQRAMGPGTFQASLFDALYLLDPDYVDQMARVKTLG